jgi:hypothetical protein
MILQFSVKNYVGEQAFVNTKEAHSADLGTRLVDLTQEIEDRLVMFCHFGLKLNKSSACGECL